MKTYFLKSAVLVASMLAAMRSASAETLHARVPFGFSAGGVAMTAGAYSIRPVPYTAGALLFENETTKTQAIVFVRTVMSTPNKPTEPLTFVEGSAGMELTNIAAEERIYELGVRSARRALKGAALAIAPARK